MLIKMEPIRLVRLLIIKQDMKHLKRFEDIITMIFGIPRIRVIITTQDNPIIILAKEFMIIMEVQIQTHILIHIYFTEVAQQPVMTYRVNGYK
jgi:hypothetical protein